MQLRGNAVRHRKSFTLRRSGWENRPDQLLRPTTEPITTMRVAATQMGVQRTQDVVEFWRQCNHLIAHVSASRAFSGFFFPSRPTRWSASRTDWSSDSPMSAALRLRERAWGESIFWAHPSQHTSPREPSISLPACWASADRVSPQPSEVLCVPATYFGVFDPRHRQLAGCQALTRYGSMHKITFGHLAGVQHRLSELLRFSTRL